MEGMAEDINGFVISHEMGGVSITAAKGPWYFNPMHVIGVEPGYTQSGSLFDRPDGNIVGVLPKYEGITAGFNLIVHLLLKARMETVGSEDGKKCIHGLEDWTIVYHRDD